GRADLAPRLARPDLPHRERELRGGDERILPLVHRRRPRMVREARDDDVVFVDRDDALHDADRHGGFFQVAALLDVQLEVAVERSLLAPRVEDAIRIAADLPDRVGAPHALPHFVEIRRLDVAGDDAAAGEAAREGDAFLVRPDDHLERMPRAGARGGERLHRTERGERAEVAVEVAAARYRVDVRAEENGRQRRI